MTRIIESLSDIQANYDAVFCDLWGCLHNGVAPFPAAVKALEDFAAAGGTVMLLTNSPRPADSVVAQLDGMGVAQSLYQGVTSSGDAARMALKAGMFGEKVYHLGPARDMGFFNGIFDDTDTALVPLEEAEGIVCTGLFDDTVETPEDYRLTIATGVNMGLKMLCANPDIFVDRGEQRIYCAGAIAQAYEQAGGDARYFGKPHAPIYGLAQERLNDLLGRDVPADRILCIGDGINTDVRGGVGEGLDTLFITGGLAAAETGTEAGGQPDADKLEAFLKAAKLSPTYSAGFLR